MKSQKYVSSNTNKNRMKYTKKKILVSVLILLLLIAIVGVVNYLSFSLSADEEARNAMTSTSEVMVEQIGNTIVFTPTDTSPTIGYIYYPGGQVEPESFAYAAREIAKSGIKVIIQKMPFNLAILGKDRAFSVIETYTDIERWYIGGFSLGGVCSCMVASKNPDIFEGVILYASYTTKNYSLVDSELKVLSISGGNDGLATPEKIENGKFYLPDDTKYIQIEGGNHTQFAIYGGGNLQKGDNEAAISRMEQQKIVIDETVAFINP